MTTKLKALNKALRRLKAAKAALDATFDNYVLTRAAGGREMRETEFIDRYAVLHDAVEAVEDAEIALGRPDGE